MEKAVETLEGMFCKTEKDLDYMSRKLEHQLGNLENIDQKVNPVKLMKKMEGIKADYASLKGEVLGIQEAQKEMSNYFRTELLTLTDSLRKLEMNTGQSADMDETTQETFDQLSNLLGIPPGELHSQVCGVDCSSPDASVSGNNINGSELSSTENALCEESSQTHKKTGAKQPEKDKSDSIIDNERRRKNGVYCEISEEEFQSVSQLLTKRLDRGDVNKVYKCLWQHFKGEKNMGKLTTKEMNVMGLRVSGATGQAKLKVLRALKLCQLSKTGDVTML